MHFRTEKEKSCLLSHSIWAGGWKVFPFIEKGSGAGP
jgi:hypothetical protein